MVPLRYRGPTLLILATIFSTLLLHSAHCAENCPPWTLPDNSSKCVCGDDLKGLVICTKELEVSVMYCYCITYNTDSNMTLLAVCQTRSVCQLVMQWSKYNNGTCIKNKSFRCN